MSTTPEKNAAEQIRMLVHRLNESVADACRDNGLSVTYVVHEASQVDMPKNEFLSVIVSKPL